MPVLLHRGYRNYPTTLPMSIKKKILITLILLSVVPISILGRLSYVKAREVLIDELVLTSIATLENTHDIIFDHYIREKERLIETLSLDENLSRALSDPRYLEKPMADWETYLRLKPRWWWIYMATDRGEIHVKPAWEPPAWYDPRKRPWYKAALEKRGQVVWTEPYKELITDKMVLSVVKAVEGEDGSVGVVGMDTRLEEIGRLISEIKIGNKGYILLVGRDGKVIAGGRPDRFGEDLTVKSWYREITSGSKGAYYHDERGEEFFISHVKVIGKGWNLVGVTSSSELERGLDRIKARTLFVGLAGVVAAILVSVLTSGYLVRNIRNLMDYMERVEEGDLTVRPVKSGGDEFNKLNVSFGRMVQRLSETMGRLERLSITDGLTDLYNHRHIIELVEAEMAKAERYKRSLSIIMLDVDYFKSINDIYGHQFGDKVLTAIAGKMKEELRAQDVVGRYGGEEFMVILPETDISAAFKAAERIRLGIAGIDWEIEAMKVTVSCGVKQFNDESLADFIDDADKLLYMAKESGRNRTEK